MPSKLYDKDKILDSCFELFVREGYANTTTAMLSEEAGISKALLFHHFKSKKNLYITILENCFEQLANELEEEEIASFTDFFDAKERGGLPRINYLRQHPDISKFLYEAYSITPDDLQEDIHRFTVDIRNKYSSKEQTKTKLMKGLFEQVPLRDGVRPEEALELINIVDDYFKNKIATELTDETKLLDDTYWDNLILTKKRILNMIRFGIEQEGE